MTRSLESVEAPRNPGGNAVSMIPQPHGGALMPPVGRGNTLKTGKRMTEAAKERRRARRQLVNVVLNRVAPLLTKKKLEEMDGTELAEIAHKLMDAGTPKPRKGPAVAAAQANSVVHFELRTIRV